MDTPAPPLLTPTTVAVATVVVLLAYASTPSAQERAVRHLPTPVTTFPVLRVTVDIMRHQGVRIYDWLLETSRRFDGQPWRMQVLGRPVTIILSSTAAVEHILKTKFEDFVKGPVTSSVLHDVLGEGIFAVDGARWAHQRKTASHLFSSHMLHTTMEQVVRSHSEQLCMQLRELARRQQAIDMKRQLDLFTMDVFTKIGFGIDLGGLARGAEETAAFLDAFERSSRALLYRFQQPMWLWQLKRWLNVGVERQLRCDRAVIDRMVHGIISQSIAEKQMRPHGDKGDDAKRSKRHDLISLFLTKTDDSSAHTDANVHDARDGDETVDVQRIRDMAVNFIAAGRDTTSQSMSWFLLMMNRYPAVLARVRDELVGAVPELTQGTRTPRLEEVQDLPYFEAAIRESLRLNPVVAISTRTAARDTTLHDGTRILAGTRVVFSSYVLARLPSVWGPDAEQFNPDRWLDAQTGKLRAVSPFQFPVFLAGPRMCLGKKFAYMEMKITLATLLSKMELRTIRDPFAFTYRPSVTLSIREPLVMRITERLPTGLATE